MAAWEVRKQSDFVLGLPWEFRLNPTQQQIGLDPDFPEFHDGVLGRLGFDFPCAGDERYQGDVDEKRLLGPFLEPHLSDGFQKRQTLDIPDRSTNFGDDHIHIWLCQESDP